MGHVMWPCPFHGQFITNRLELAIINLYTKFEVSMFIHYKDIKGNAKCRIWSGLGVRGDRSSPAVSSLDRAPMTSYSTLVETMHLSCTVFKLWQVSCRKLPILIYPTCIWNLHCGWSPSNFAKTFSIRKLQSLSYHVASFAWFCI